ncbi:MAG: class I SAM-dependent methyltransferase [Candidatus Aureabacteria bacterium]|nr:class I SAM-dependent methyltransferase [Candidatus Auribacterota bacterium]
MKKTKSDTTGSKRRETLENKTGSLFENLWPQYDEVLFKESVELFYKRLADWKIPGDFFKNKKCLDAGCGGGRNSIAMASLGASEVQGIDLGDQGLKDAARRAKGLGITQANFQKASVLDIPFEDNYFDCIWFAGVLMITDDPDKALDELTRVLKPGGSFYLLVYANGGMRWPLIEILRKLAHDIGLSAVEEAIARGNLPANKRRTFLDDLFCPALDFYSWERMEKMLEVRGFEKIRRMPRDKWDHEASLEEFEKDLASFQKIFSSGVEYNIAPVNLFRHGKNLCQAVIDTVADTAREEKQGLISHEQAMERIAGQGHHRVWAVKGNK